MKKFALSAFLVLFAALIAIAQSDPQARPSAKPSPANKAAKVETAQPKADPTKVEHAEERSDGAAFSGRGKGGEKGSVEKGKRGKGKAKGHHKSKHKGKGQNKQKGQGDDDDNGSSRRGSKTEPGPRGDEGPAGRPAGGTMKTRRPQSTEPAEAPAGTKKPETTRGRKPGDKPTPGTEIKREKQRG